MVQLGTVTITGYAGGNPVTFGKDGGPPACSFRLGCTRGYYDADHVWRSFPTTWITVKAFRRLASNVCQSVRKGDAVIVTGQLATEEWTSQGEGRSRIVVEAASIGHDLNGGVTYLQRLQKSTSNDGKASDPFASGQGEYQNGGFAGRESATAGFQQGDNAPVYQGSAVSTGSMPVESLSFGTVSGESNGTGTAGVADSRSLDSAGIDTTDSNGYNSAAHVGSYSPEMNGSNPSESTGPPYSGAVSIAVTGDMSSDGDGSSFVNGDRNMKGGRNAQDYGEFADPEF